MAHASASSSAFASRPSRQSAVSGRRWGNAGSPRVGRRDLLGALRRDLARCPLEADTPKHLAHVAASYANVGDEECALEWMERGSSGNQRSPAGLRQAIRYFERAVEADPRYARAWAGLADAHIVLPFYDGTDPRSSQAQVRAAAERALEIDDSLAEAHAALALSIGMFDWDFERGEELFRHANERDPNHPVAHQWYGDLLSGLGRFEEAIAELERARELDPLYTAGLDDLGLAYATAGRHAEGVRTLREAIELDPEFPLARMHLGLSYLAMGEAPSAAAELEQAVTSSGAQPAYSLLLAVAVARMGRNDEARTILDGVLAQSKERYVPPLPVALVHRALGDEEEAFQGFERAFEARDIWTLMIPIAYDPELRADPRFRELARRHGLPASFTALPPSP